MLEQVLGIPRKQILEVRYYMWEPLYQQVSSLPDGIVARTLKEHAQRLNRFIYKTKDSDKDAVKNLIDSIQELSENESLENKKYLQRLRKIGERITFLERKTLF